MNQRAGFTLIELLIVVAILGLLIQLMLPAVQMSKEAARRTQCQNNLRQIGLACQAQIGATGRFPTGGWGFLWAGDPDRGNDRRQPGGWVYNLLPYSEQASLHDLAAGQTGDDKLQSTTSMCETPLPYFICPSRRRVKLYPYSEFSAYPMRNTMFFEKTAKTDYAASAGDYFFHGVEGPRSLSEGDSPSYDDWHDLSKSTGVIYQRSEVEPRQVIDGMTKTYLIGEKYLRVDRYRTGFDTGDDQTMYCGFDPDINRWTTNDHGIVNPPKADNSDAGLDPYRFGSPHPDGCSFVFCDGSVRIIQYTIDDETHRAFGNREDGQYIE